jgi:cellulose biosynthesis protein BcsQ
MLRTVIRESARLADNFNYRTTILKHAPTSTGAADYRAVARELLERYQVAPKARLAAGVGGSV